MSLLLGCSELKETARLVEELLGVRAPASPANGPTLVYSRAAAAPKTTPPAATGANGAVDSAAIGEAAGEVEHLAPTLPRATHDSTEAGVSQLPASAPKGAGFPPEVMPTFTYRGERLEYILSSMCRRGGLSGAVVADGKGLPLADFNSPVAGEILAAFTSVLGSALERAGQLLGESGAELISMDINYTDKVVLRRFTVAAEPYFLMVICSQELDERTELELSIEQLMAALSE